MKEITLEARQENVRALTEMVDAELEKLDCPMKAQMQIDLCVEEVFVNIASYAYGSGEGKAEIRISEQQGEVTLTFLDSGTPYDPLQKEDPDTKLDAESRKIGGLGIFLVKKNMDDVQYRFVQGKNMLTMKKRIHS